MMSTEFQPRVKLTKNCPTNILYCMVVLYQKLVVLMQRIKRVINASFEYVDAPSAAL